MLSDPVQRLVYDEIHGYALTAINPFVDDSSTKDLAFVDEFSCIGMCEFSLRLFNPCTSMVTTHLSFLSVYSTHVLPGCKNCANVAPDVFGIEEDFGRARVYSQCGNPQRVQEAIDSW